MSGWLTSQQEREPFLEAISIFLREGAKIPLPILRSGTNLVGFVDECEARQSESFFHSFTRFLFEIDEQSFCFIWLPQGYKPSDQNESYPMYFFDSSQVDAKNFVRLQSSEDEEIFESDAWLLVSYSKRWAIYGEQYGSEMALLLSRDDSVTAAMLGSFPELITDPSTALATIGDQSQTEEGAHFEREFLKNYSTVLVS